jgi:hypothetical protein
MICRFINQYFPDNGYVHLKRIKKSESTMNLLICSQKLWEQKLIEQKIDDTEALLFPRELNDLNLRRVKVQVPLYPPSDIEQHQRCNLYWPTTFHHHQQYASLVAYYLLLSTRSTPSVSLFTDIEVLQFAESMKVAIGFAQNSREKV